MAHLVDVCKQAGGALYGILDARLHCARRDDARRHEDDRPRQENARLHQETLTQSTFPALLSKYKRIVTFWWLEMHHKIKIPGGRNRKSARDLAESHP